MTIFQIFLEKNLKFVFHVRHCHVITVCMVPFRPTANLRKLNMEMTSVTRNMSKLRHVKKTRYTESAYVRSCSMKELTDIWQWISIFFKKRKQCLYSGESRASSRANYVITYEKLCWSVSFQNVYHNKRKVIKKFNI